MAAALGQNNYQFQDVRATNTEAFDVKLTYQASTSDSLSLRFNYQRPKVFDPGTYGIYGGPTNGGFAGTGTNDTYASAVNWTHTFSSSAILDTRAGFSYYHNQAVSQADGLKTSSDLGITGVNVDNFTAGITSIDVSHYSNPVIGFSASLPWDRSETTYNVASTLTKLAGNHTVKVGFDIRHNRDFLLQVQDNGGPRGIFRYRSAQTAIPSDTAAQNGYANSFASFLLDVPQSIARDLEVTQPGTRHWEFFTFIGDKWQVTPKLTLDLGIRHEFYTPLTGLVDQGGLSNFDPATNNLLIAGYGGVPQDFGVKKTWTNFAPRLGVAFRINPETVLRAGFGVSIIPFPDNQYAYNFPVKQNNQFNPINSFASIGSLATGFPAPIVFSIPQSGIVPAIGPLLNQGYNVVPLDLHEGKIYAWNVAVQRQLPLKFAIEVAYVANRTRGQLARDDLNAGLVPGLDNAGRPAFAPYGRTASSNSWVPTNTQYDSMQVKLDRRFSNGLLWNGSYTLSRAKDYVYDDGGTGGIGTPANLALSYGPSNLDRLHSFVSSFVYELPFFKESKGAANSILGGWQVGGIFVAQSGTPVDITISGATLRAPGNTQRPDLIGTQQVLGKVGPGQQWFSIDPTIYAAPAPNTFGNMTRNAGPRGPGYVNLDASLVKRVKLSGKMSAELRLDAFNVFNHPHFNNPNGSFGNASFGQITGSFGERFLRFGARVAF